MLFLDLVNFIKEDAELVTDPIFSPESLKKERLKSSERPRCKNAKQRTAGASSFVSSSLVRRSSPVSCREGPSKGGRRVSVPQVLAQYVEKPTAQKSARS